MFDLFGSPNQFDYVNLKYVPSQIFFTHTIKDLWRHKPWEVETQTLGSGDTNLGNKIHATRQNQKSTELFNFQINFFSFCKNNVMSTLELQEQLIRKIQIMTDDDILAGVLQFIAFETEKDEIHVFNEVEQQAIAKARQQVADGQFYTDDEVNKPTTP